MKVAVIIPAAGLGTRMSPAPSAKSKIPSKQFTELGGTPLLIHTLRKFAASPRVTEILVALRKDEILGFRERLQSDGPHDKRVELVEGGEHRQESVANVLAARSSSNDDIVIVHHAAR